MNIILLGAPGAGKGTQAEIICEKYEIPQISTGNIIRESVKNGTEMGKEAKAYMDKGALVPDEVVIGIIKERLRQEDCQNGFILDGFPRTVPQAEALDAMGIVIDKVIDIEVRDEAIEKRLTGRRVCAQCGASFHVETKPSAKGDRCDKCGGELIIRKDDSPETVADRLKVYHTETEPLKDYYQKQGKLTVVDGEQEISETTRLTLAALEA